jgi:hypothetical protein
VTPEALCIPGRLDLEAARATAIECARADPRFDAEIAYWLSRHNFAEGTVVNNAVAMRALELLEAIGGSSVRILPLLIRLQRSGDERVRSKAAALMGRSNRNPAWYRSLFAGDARTLANAVDSLWGSQWEGARAVFVEAVESGDPRVAANAVVGLFRLGEVEQAEGRLASMTVDSDPRRRASAAWAAGVVNHPPLLPALARLIDDPHPHVRRNAVRALARIRRNRAA